MGVNTSFLIYASFFSFYLISYASSLELPLHSHCPCPFYLWEWEDRNNKFSEACVLIYKLFLKSLLYNLLFRPFANVGWILFFSSSELKDGRIYFWFDCNKILKDYMSFVILYALILISPCSPSISNLMHIYSTSKKSICYGPFSWDSRDVGLNNRSPPPPYKAC